jgi:hypothetical protein
MEWGREGGGDAGAVPGRTVNHEAASENRRAVMKTNQPVALRAGACHPVVTNLHVKRFAPRGNLDLGAVGPGRA